MLREKTSPSAWTYRTTTFNFLLFLIRAKLTSTQLPYDLVSTFVRRHKSKYDTSSSNFPLFEW